MFVVVWRFGVRRVLPVVCCRCCVCCVLFVMFYMLFVIVRRALIAVSWLFGARC